MGFLDGMFASTLPGDITLDGLQKNNGDAGRRTPQNKAKALAEQRVDAMAGGASPGGAGDAPATGGAPLAPQAQLPPPRLPSVGTNQFGVPADIPAIPKEADRTVTGPSYSYLDASNTLQQDNQYHHTINPVTDVPNRRPKTLSVDPDNPAADLPENVRLAGPLNSVNAGQLRNNRYSNIMGRTVTPSDPEDVVDQELHNMGVGGRFKQIGLGLLKGLALGGPGGAISGAILGGTGDIYRKERLDQLNAQYQRNRQMGLDQLAVERQRDLGDYRSGQLANQEKRTETMGELANQKNATANRAIGVREANVQSLAQNRQRQRELQQKAEEQQLEKNRQAHLDTVQRLQQQKEIAAQNAASRAAAISAANYRTAQREQGANARNEARIKAQQQVVVHNPDPWSDDPYGVVNRATGEYTSAKEKKKQPGKSLDK